MLSFVYAVGLIVLSVSLLKRKDFEVCLSPVFVVAFVAAILIGITEGWADPDLESWYQQWGSTVSRFGLPAAYGASPIPINYPPLYPAILGLCGDIVTLFHFGSSNFAALCFRIPPIIALFSLPVIMNAILRRNQKAVSLHVLAAVTVLNPALFYISVLWGQCDVLLCDLMLLTFLALESGLMLRVGMCYAAALLLKPQALFAAPAIVGWFMARNTVRPFLFSAVGFTLVFLAMLPVIVGHGGVLYGYFWLVKLYVSIGQTYDYVSGYAATLLTLYSGPVLTYDSRSGPFGLSYLLCSLIFDLVTAIAISLAASRDLRIPSAIRNYWYLALSLTLAYYVSVRMHERYLMYGTVAALLWTLLVQTRIAKTISVLLSASLLMQVLLAFDIPIGPWLGRSLILSNMSIQNYFPYLFWPQAIGILLLIASAGSSRNDQHMAPARSIGNV